MPHSDQDQDLYRRAVSLLNGGDPEGAYALYRKLFPRHKTNPDFLLQMAITAVNLKKYDRAKKLAENVLKISPHAGPAHNVLGAIAINRRHLPAAVDHFRNCVACTPQNIDAYLNLANALNLRNRSSEALEQLRHASELAPNRADIHYLIAAALRSLGQTEAAGAACRRALDLTPDYAGAWKLLADMGQLSVAQDITQIEALIAEGGLPPANLGKLHFALAARLEKDGDFNAAFDHYRIGNALIRETLDYDVSNDEDLMERIAETFQPALLNRLRAQNTDRERMIFIVGMPRSGTTLVEHILASHSSVYAAGETPYMQHALATHGATKELTYPESARRWKHKHIHSIGRAYLRSIDALNDIAPHVTEKLPGNFLYLGAIHAIFPQARIIHCRRDPIDTCLGNYRQLFTSGQYFSYSQDDLVRYYKAYARLMKHWHSALGDCIMDIQYEQLVDAPEPTARKIVAHCGLDWEDACIDVRKASRPVRTASATQIRDGIHSGYVERWRKFENHIQPLIEGLSAT